MAKGEQTVEMTGEVENSDAELLDRVFFALSDPVRRAILERLGGGALLVSELAAPFDISLQAVSRHIHVLLHVPSYLDVWKLCRPESNIVYA